MRFVCILISESLSSFFLLIVPSGKDAVLKSKWLGKIDYRQSLKQKDNRQKKKKTQKNPKKQNKKKTPQKTPHTLQYARWKDKEP